MKRVIADGGLALGGLTGSFAGSTIVELYALAGVDAILIDLEHNGFDFDQIQLMIIAAEAAGVTSIVRLPGFDRGLINRLLDMGAEGIQLDGISSAEQARALVDAMHYPPTGTRGLIWNSRSARFGAIAKDEYQARANAEVLVKISIDDEPGVEAAEDIAAVEGVDIIGVGAHDLSSDLGVIGHPNHSRLAAAIDKVIKTVSATGPGRLALPLDSAAYTRTAAELVQLGVGFTNLQPHPEQRLLKAFSAQVRSVREAAGQSAEA